MLDGRERGCVGGQSMGMDELADVTGDVLVDKQGEGALAVCSLWLRVGFLLWVRRSGAELTGRVHGGVARSLGRGEGTWIFLDEASSGGMSFVWSWLLRKQNRHCIRHGIMGSGVTWRALGMAWLGSLLPLRLVVFRSMFWGRVFFRACFEASVYLMHTHQTAGPDGLLGI